MTYKLQNNDFQLFISENNLKKKDIAEYLGVSGAFITQLFQGLRDIPTDKLALIKSNPEWDVSMLDKGKMLKHGTIPVSQEANYETFLLPVSAQGGSLSNFSDSVMYDQCERIISPIKDVSFAMPVTGDSMEPEYPNGSKVLLKKINERAFVEWGRCYVLDTCNGAVIKKLMPADDDSMFRCVSINPTYPSFDVCLSDIYGVYRVLMMLAEK